MKTTWPPVTITTMPKAERDAKLAEGIAYLAELVDREQECVELISGLLHVAQIAKGDSDEFADRIGSHTDFLRKLQSSFSSAGKTQYMEVNGELAESAEKCLGIASGLWQLMSGGQFTGDDEKPIAVPVETMGIEIARFGLKLK